MMIPDLVAAMMSGEPWWAVEEVEGQERTRYWRR
jgi:hypothetical protein